ncbi:MAG: AraC family transcriptional regulator [Clostridia bacterium]
MRKDIMKQNIMETLNLYETCTGAKIFYLKTNGLFTSPCLVDCCPYNCKRKCYSHLEAMSRLIKVTDEPTAVVCRMGLSLLCAPIYINKKYKGALFSQPYFLESEETKEDYASEFALVYEMEVKALVEVLAKLDVYTEEKADALRDLLVIFLDKIKVNSANFIEGDEVVFEEEITESKDVEEMRDKISTEKSAPTTYQSEAMFENCLKAGDRNGALEAVKKLMSEVLLLCGQDLEVIRFRATELAVIMSRTRSNKDNVLELFLDNVEFFRELNKASNLDDVVDLIVKYVNDFIEVSDVMGKNINYTIASAKEYIRKNCNRELSLKEVSDKVFLSASYFSRIFKQKAGEKYIDYLNRTRIEESLIYLKDIKVDLAQIAKVMGFSDQSYYTKVFKRFMGVSPNVYRKNYRMENAGMKRKSAKKIEDDDIEQNNKQ